MSDAPSREYSYEWYAVKLAQLANYLYLHALWTYPILFLITVGLVVLIAHHPVWRNFATTHKWRARIALFAVILAMLFLSAQTSNWLMWQIKGKLSPEFPSLTSDAIKMGIYGIELRPQMAMAVPPERKDLFDCVYALSEVDGHLYLDTYKNSPAGVQSIPKMSKDAIMEEIKKIQSGKPSADPQLQPCYRVKL